MHAQSAHHRVFEPDRVQNISSARRQLERSPGRALESEELLRLLCVPRLRILKATVRKDVDAPFMAQLAALCPALEFLDIVIHDGSSCINNLDLTWYQPFSNLTRVEMWTPCSFEDVNATLNTCHRLTELNQIRFLDDEFDVEKFDCSLGQMLTLSLSECCPLTSRILSFLNKCGSLTALDLWNMQADLHVGSVGLTVSSDPFFYTYLLISSLTCELKSLNVGGDDVGDEDVRAICTSMPSITSLELTNAIITDAALSSIHGLPNLEALDLSYSTEQLSGEALGSLVAASSQLRTVTLARGEEYIYAPSLWKLSMLPGCSWLDKIDAVLESRGGTLHDADNEYSSDDESDRY